MKCPFCQSDKLDTRDSRHKDDKIVRRKRLCKECGRGFYTLEIYENPAYRETYDGLPLFQTVGQKKRRSSNP